MALNMTTTRQAALANGIKVLVYGGPGYGKTVLCSTAPNPLIISAEKGLLSLKNFDIPVLEVNTPEELDEALQFVYTSPDMAHIQTVCMDSATEIAEQILANAKELVKDPRQAYGEMAEKMTAYIKYFRDIPGKNVVIVAKQAYVDTGSGAYKFLPSMPGKQLGPALPYYFDEVFCLRMAKDTEGNDVRYLQTQPDFQYDAKDRDGSLDLHEPPNLTHIFNKILGE